MGFRDFFTPLNKKLPEVIYFEHLVVEFDSIEAALVGGTTGPAETPAALPPPGGATRPADVGKTDAQAGEATGQDAKGAAQQAQTGAATSPGRPDAKGAATPAARRPDARRLLQEAKEKIEKMKKEMTDTGGAGMRNGTAPPSWNDLYYLELILANLRPVESLRAYVLRLRHDFRSVVGQVEYDEYLASKPKNLQDPPDPLNPPDSEANYEQLLRDDVKDLLDRLFKRYAFLPVRELKLMRLTVWAAAVSGVFLLILLGGVISMSYRSEASAAENSNAANNSKAARGDSNDNRAEGKSAQAAAGGAENRLPRLPSIALFVVLVSGAMGGFVSALQRIQSSPTEGDSLYNLSMLYHGSYAVFIAPLTGAVFAILLYFMFTGKILEGRFFPDIYTPPAAVASPTPPPSPSPTQTATAEPRPLATQPVETVGSRPTPARSPAPTPQTVANTNAPISTNTNTSNTNTPNMNAANSNAANSNTANSNVANVNTANANTGSANTSTGTANANSAAAPTPTPRQVPTASLRVKDFLYESGPAGGQDYALLIIWSFIAGFAERFVPDSLNRLVAGNQSGGQSGK